MNWVAARPALNRFEAAAESVLANLRGLVKLAGTVCVLGVLGADGWLIYKGEIVHEYTLELLRSVPPEFWIGLGIALGEVIAVVIATVVLLRKAKRLLEVLCDKAKAYEGITKNDASIERFFGSARRSMGKAAWLGVLALSSHLLGLPEVVTHNLVVLLEVFLIVAAGLLVWQGVAAVIESLDALSKKYSDSQHLLRHYGRFSPLVPLFRRAVEYGIYVGVATLVTLHIELDAVAAWGPRLIKIIGVVILSRVGIEAANLVLDEALLNRPKLTPDQRARRLTILPLTKSILKYAIYFAAVVFVLKELGVNPTPILAGAGIAAMAVGLGAQNLINDMVSGFFILFENYFLVGDYIVAGGAQGWVEQIDLRTTRIRDEDGRLHIITNGNIDGVINYSKDYTFAMVEVGVAYEENLQEVFDVLLEIGAEMSSERPDVLETTRVRGVESFGDSSVGIVTTTKVKPGCHRVVERDLRRRIKDTFDAKGIEIPYARRVVIFQNADGESISPEEAFPAARGGSAS